MGRTRPMQASIAHQGDQAVGGLSYSESGVSPSPPASLLFGVRGDSAGAAGDAASILDKKCQIMPSRGENPRHMGRKHYRARGRIRDAMRLWLRADRVLWWVTLTSSPDSPKGRLRADFQAWRKRLARLLCVEASDIQYAMVDTREGHGVLHLVLAFPPGVGEWIDYAKVGVWWLEIHGARQVKLLKVKKGDGSVRRLSQYIVSQYMVTQGEVEDLLGRISTTRFQVPIASLRRSLCRIVTARWRAYQWVHNLIQIAGSLADPNEVLRKFRSEQWREFRRCWDAVLDRGWCEVYGEKFVVEGSEVVAL